MSWLSSLPNGPSRPQSSTADQRARRSAAHTGSSQGDLGVTVAYICWPARDCLCNVCVRCRVDTLVLDVHLVWFSLSIPVSSTHWFAFSRARVLLVYLGYRLCLSFIFNFHLSLLSNMVSALFVVGDIYYNINVCCLRYPEIRSNRRRSFKETLPVKNWFCTCFICLNWCIDS